MAGRVRTPSAASCRTRWPPRKLPQPSPISEQRHAKGRAGSTEFLVERGKRQVPSLREFEIGGIVNRQAKASGKTLRRRPDLDGCFSVERDRQIAQKAGQMLAA